MPDTSKTFTGARGRAHSKGYYAGLGVMALFYVVAGVNHFRNPEMYVAIVPRYIPFHPAVVTISGIAEILGGVGVLVPDGFGLLRDWPRIRAFSAWGIAVMLVAFLPVHINMCLHPTHFAVPLWVIWLRLPLQIPLIAWAWCYTRK
jgi:uncharacterized membrane protein